MIYAFYVENSDSNIVLSTSGTSNSQTALNYGTCSIMKLSQAGTIAWENYVNFRRPTSTSPGGETIDSLCGNSDSVYAFYYTGSFPEVSSVIKLSYTSGRVSWIKQI